MRNGPKANQPPLHVRGLALPTLLVDLLKSGQWQHPGDDVLRSVLPWFQSPLTFLTSTSGMEAESAGLDFEADDERLSGLFHVTRGTVAGPIGLPWVDAELAVLIAVNRIPGDDLAVALDYRPEAGNPAVVASDVWTNPQEHLWRPAAASFEEFAFKLGMADS